MKHHPVILSIAGSDCSGGAGIQADIKTISALGGYAASAITAITVQNTLGIKAVQNLPVEIVRGQIEAVMDDLRPHAVKIGMIDEAILVRVIADCLGKYRPEYVVYDPVMVSSSGHKLMTEGTIRAIKEELFPHTTLITPNLNEASVLTGQTLTTPQEMEQAARELSHAFYTAVLIKGGHLAGEEMCDVLYADEHTYIYKEKKIESTNLHGTGCTLSSAIATFLAKGLPLDEAVGEAKAYISRAIRAGRELCVGRGNGPLWHFPEDNAQK